MKTEIVSGNFAAVIDGELNTEKQAEINEAGLTYIVQRDGLSKTYKELLSKGAKRNSLEFSDDNGAKFQAALAAALAPYGTFNVTVAQHVPSEGGAASPMVRATAFVDSLMDNGDKEQQLRGTLALFDATAAEADRDGLIAIAHKQGLGIQPPKAPKAAA